MSTELATIQQRERGFTQAQRELIKTVLAKDANLTDDELSLFEGICNRTRLDPFQRQIYAIKRGGRLGIQTSIDGFRVIAERHGQYAGQLGPFWCGADGEWKDVWLSKEPPMAAKVGVLRRDFSEPLWAVATVAQYKADGPMWQKMTPTMVAKCAEALGLRRAFPNDLANLYTQEEMDQAEETVKPFNAHPLPGKPKNYVEVVDEKTGEVTPIRTSKKRTSLLARAHIIKTNLQISDEIWKGRLTKSFNVDSSAKLNEQQLEQLVKALEAAAQKDAEARAGAAQMAAEQTAESMMTDVQFGLIRGHLSDLGMDADEVLAWHGRTEWKEVTEKEAADIVDRMAVMLTNRIAKEGQK